MILILYDTNDVMQYPFLNTIDSNYKYNWPNFYTIFHVVCPSIVVPFSHYRMMTDKKKEGWW